MNIKHLLILSAVVTTMSGCATSNHYAELQANTMSHTVNRTALRSVLKEYRSSVRRDIIYVEGKRYEVVRYPQ